MPLPSNADWWQYAAGVSAGLPDGALISATLTLVAPTFLGSESGPTVADLLQGAVDNINAFTAQAITSALIKRDLQDNLAVVTSRIAGFRMHLSEFGPPKGKGLTPQATLAHYTSARQKLQNLYEIGSADFDLALDKLLRPELAHHGLNTFMDGATFAIMISALSIRLDQMVHIATTMASTKLTQQEKDKLIAWPTTVPATIATHIRLSDDYIQRACNGFHNLLRNCYGYIRVDDPAPLSHATKPPMSIDFRPDGTRFRVHMQDLPKPDDTVAPPLGTSPFFGLYLDSPLTPKFAEDWVKDQINVHFGDVSVGIRALQTQRATWCTYLSAQLHATKVELENTPSGAVPFQDFKGESFKPFPQFDTYKTVINWADYPLPPYTEAPAPDKPLSIVHKPGLGLAARGVVIRGGASGASSLSVDAPGEKVVLAVEDGRAIWSILFASDSSGSLGAFVILHHQTNKVLCWIPRDPNQPSPRAPQADVGLAPFDPITSFSDKQCQFERWNTDTRWEPQIIFHKDFASPGMLSFQTIMPAGAGYTKDDEVKNIPGFFLVPDNGHAIFKAQSLVISGSGMTDNFPGWVFDTADNDADGFSASGLFGH